MECIKVPSGMRNLNSVNTKPSTACWSVCVKKHRIWSINLASIGHHRLKATDELFQMLEDNQVSLATMKASRYVKAFEVEVG